MSKKKPNSGRTVTQLWPEGRPTRQALPPREAAHRLGISYSTIRKKFRREIGVVKVFGSTRVPIEEVERILREGWQPPLSLIQVLGSAPTALPDDLPASDEEFGT